MSRGVGTATWCPEHPVGPRGRGGGTCLGLEQPDRWTDPRTDQWVCPVSVETEWGRPDTGFCLWNQRGLQGGVCCWGPWAQIPTAQPKQTSGQGRGGSVLWNVPPPPYSYTHTWWPPGHQSTHHNTQPSHTYTHAHTPHRAVAQKVTEHITQTRVPHAAPHCDMAPRHTCSDTTFTPTK